MTRPSEDFLDQNRYRDEFFAFATSGGQRARRVDERSRPMS
jgi:hypothetical protein